MEFANPLKEVWLNSVVNANRHESLGDGKQWRLVVTSCSLKVSTVNIMFYEIDSLMCTMV